MSALIESLRAFVQFETISGNRAQKQACADWIATTFFSEFSAKLQRGVVNDCPYILLENPDAQLLWFAHFDVVPGIPEQFSVRTEGRKAFGRGVKDMKGACVPFLLAFQEEVRAGNTPPVSVLFTSDEEIAGQSIPTLIAEGLKPPAAFTPDTGSSLGIVTEHKAILWAELTARGDSTHGAMPWKGENAVWLLADALERIHKALPAPASEKEWGMTVSPTSLKGSDTKNQTPATAVCGLDIRYPPERYSDAAEVLSVVQKSLPMNCDVTEVLSAPGLSTDPKHPMVQLIKKLADECTGREVPFIREHGGTDARYFATAGIPAFLFGPDGGDLHGPNEWVSLDSLEQHHEMYRRLFEVLR
ncbi:M20/M25/M40 family metallo-hydrolase [Candidatus Peregrinibacteria bacterium]|nr:M20/M25/M40 family metallo-hydrolase [Candidatus Peregrinibacteria bacterium]